MCPFHATAVGQIASAALIPPEVGPGRRRLQVALGHCLPRRVHLHAALSLARLMLALLMAGWRSLCTHENRCSTLTGCLAQMQCSWRMACAWPLFRMPIRSPTIKAGEAGAHAACCSSMIMPPTRRHRGAALRTRRGLQRPNVRRDQTVRRLRRCGGERVRLGETPGAREERKKKRGGDGPGMLIAVRPKA